MSDPRAAGQGGADATLLPNLSATACFGVLAQPRPTPTTPYTTRRTSAGTEFGMCACNTSIRCRFAGSSPRPRPHASRPRPLTTLALWRAIDAHLPRALPLLRALRLPLMQDIYLLCYFFFMRCFLIVSYFRRRGGTHARSLG